MLYLFTPIDTHADFGFGLTAESYYESAEALRINELPEKTALQQREMPQNYLYRHSIELYLKSLIILFHKRLDLNYGDVPFDSDQPQVLINGKWIKLYNCHYIDALYSYFVNELLLKYREQLESLAPQGDWQEPKEVTESLAKIAQYDWDSSYFRYPVTRNTELDKQKFTMQLLPKSDDINKAIASIEDAESIRGQGGFSFIKLNEKDEVESVYSEDHNVLKEIRDALQQAAYILHCLHIMTRCTLYKNF